MIRRSMRKATLIGDDVRVDAALDQSDVQGGMSDSVGARIARLQRFARGVQRGKNLRRRGQRVDAAFRHRRMPLSAVHDHFQVQAAVVGRGHRVGEAGTDGEIGLAQALREQSARADLAADLLVAGQMQLDRAVELRAMRGKIAQSKQRIRVRCKIGFADCDAPAEHRGAVFRVFDDVGRVRIVRPALAGRHDVAVRVQRDRRPTRSEALAHHQVRRRNHAVGADIAFGYGSASTLRPSASSSACARRACGRSRRADCRSAP